MLTPDANSYVPPADQRQAPREGSGCVQYALFVLTAFWVLAVTFLIQIGAWGYGQIMLIQDDRMPGLVWLLVTWGNALVILPPLVLGALVSRAPRLRAAYQIWALSAAFAWLLAFARWIPETRAELGMASQGVLALAAIAIVMWLARGRDHHLRVRSSVMPAIILSPIVVAPWAAFGALGGPMDTLLGLFAGLAFGLFAGVLLDAFLLAPLAAIPDRSVLFVGFSAAIALAILASSFGFGGNQLLLMASLPSIGFAVAALGLSAPDGDQRGQWLPVSILIGAATAAVLLFFDTKELTILLDEGNGDIPTWAAVAAGSSILLGWLAGLVGRVIAVRRSSSLIRGASIAAVGSWAALLLVYLGYGQPGFHGDALFVILRDQADLSAAASIPDRTERARFVYSTLSSHATSSQASLREELNRLGLGYKPYYLVNGVEVEGGPLVRMYLSSRPEVDRIIDSPRLRPLPEPPSVEEGDRGAPATPDWNITSIGADRVWNELGVTGKGITVGQSDSGVEGTHPALQEAYRGRNGGDDFNWLDPWNDTRSPTDIGGHGTHTLGSVLGKGGIGVAPDAEWFGCVNLARNMANPPLYLDCMQFMLAPHPQGANPLTEGDPSMAAHVTNNSWGCPEQEGCDSTSLLPAVTALRAAGIFVAVSAGNSGPDCGSVSDPIAIYDGSFTVGAVNVEGDVSYFSSRGPSTVEGKTLVKPDIVAPGEEVLSAYPGGRYKIATGTSMAGPHVAGVVALMWSAQPRLIGDIDRTEQILISTARPYRGSQAEGCFRGSVPNDGYGYGVLDAYAAVKAALDLK